MNKLIYIVLIFIAIVVGGFFILNNGGPEDTSEQASHLQSANIGKSVDATGEAEVGIVINDFIFETTELKITEGTTVTWTNSGTAAHDVVSTPDSPKQGLDSELLGNGESYSYTFDEPGIYNYICSPHPRQMRATIEVVPAN